MPPSKERTTIDVRAERAVLAAVRLPDSTYDPADPFGELRALAEQAGATVVGELEQRLSRPQAGTYMGKGKVLELKQLCEALGASTIIFDHDLSPAQIAAIERLTERKVLDRSELILDIFASRATTYEAKLQVELAQLEYTYPRLRAMWSHLERIVGTGGIAGVGTRGPGEQQLEIDRRLVQRRKLELQRELQRLQARKRRAVRERNAQRFTVGLVGYTNAGKSTLFNTLTAGGAYADDRVFATLMTRTRAWNLGGGVEVMLSDTVGFVRDLPHRLIASFRATLEEATHADVLIVVLDVSDPACEMQYHTVMKTLDDLDAQTARQEDAQAWSPPQRVVVLNKIDRLPDNRQLLVWRQRLPEAIALCALPPGPGQERPGQRELADRIRALAEGGVHDLTLTIDLANARAIHLLETQAKVLDRRYENGAAIVRAEVSDRLLRTLAALGVRTPAVGSTARRAGWKGL
ncbi:MAG: GTPase HflX [Phycisphaerales bacterium]|nr:MAG: GTPase HflX [Phycisphaerales bacterium]